MISNMIPFHCHVPVQQHNTHVTTKVMTSTDTIKETSSNGTNLLTPPQSKTHHSDHSHHHSSSHHHHDHRPITLSKNKSKDPSRLICSEVHATEGRTKEDRHEGHPYHHMAYDLM
jgi:hypothetical protein